MALPKTTIHDEDVPEVNILTREEAFDALDGMSRYWLDMSGEEFLRHWKDGDFADPQWDDDHTRIEHIGIWALQFINEQ